MKIIEYSPKYKQDFIDFNTDWIISNFGSLEEDDYILFNNLEKYIQSGAMIYFAIDDNGTPLACCMTHKLDGTTWEINKFASNKNINHKGAGTKVFEACMKWAKTHGAKRLYIISNTHLPAALHIYHKHGFKDIPAEENNYVRGDIFLDYYFKEDEKNAD